MGESLKCRLRLWLWDSEALKYYKAVDNDKTAADSAAAEKSLLFLPGQLTDGIEPSEIR